jgi:hypothetical protein
VESGSRIEPQHLMRSKISACLAVVMFNVKMFAEMMEGSEQMMQLKLES